MVSFTYSFLYLCLILLYVTHCGAKNYELNCSSVKRAYDTKHLPGEDVPGQPIPGNNLKICTQELSCCTNEMEYKLATLSRIKFDQKLRKILIKLKNFFAVQRQAIDDFFRELLTTSKREFHEMFLRTYGMLYDTNSYIFQDMFEDLEKYYITGKVDLSEAMDYFFQRLYKKMFQVLNSQYQFSERYLKCIGTYMEQMKPFGDIPQKLIVEIKRSFIAIRAFVQALTTGRDVAKNMLEVDLAPECRKAVMKMTYCSHCQGMPHLRSCNSYCSSVFKGCLAYHTELDNKWSEYTDSLLMLASRLENSFNIESVVDPIDIKISDAIMNFQENGNAVSKLLFDQCGQPKLGKRSIEQKFYSKSMKHHGAENITHANQANAKSLDYLVQGMKKRIKQNKHFWVELPQKMCRSFRAVNDSRQNTNCWSQWEKTSYQNNWTGDEHRYPPEIYVDVTQQNSLVNQQILILKLITKKMSHAYSGLDIEWDDTEFEWKIGGSGGGYDSKDEDEEEDTLDDFAGIDFKLPNIYSSTSASFIKYASNTGEVILPRWFMIFFLLLL